MSDVTARGTVHGRVQGVGYRAFTRHQALRRGVAGYARNRPDGSVAFALTGSRDDVEAVLRSLREGPPLARVDSVDVAWYPAEPMRGFESG